MSLLLFILYSEFLTRLIFKEERKGKMLGIKIFRSAPTITHLMYADDLLVMGRANKLEAKSFRHCFDLYCKWSGQKANLDKSNILFSKHTPRVDKRTVLHVTGFK